jgi:hypothetical protein
MSCCGKKRTAYPAPATRRPGPESNGALASTAAPPVNFEFEYLGGTTMTVLGPVSGRHYRFVGHGARLAVDPRDRLSLAAVPGLREVRFS